MLKTAKITMDYNEFSLIMERNKCLEAEVKSLESVVNEFTESNEIKALDAIEKVLQKARKAKTTERKKLIDDCLIIYAKTFNIPEDSIFND